MKLTVARKDMTCHQNITAVSGAKKLLLEFDVRVAVQHDKFLS